MLETALSSARLFIAGKLFRDNRMVVRQLAIGVAAGAVTTILVGLAGPLWLACLAGGAVSGAAQPRLFRDLKYA